MDRAETLYRLPIIQISESDTDESDLEELTLVKTAGRNQRQRAENIVEDGGERAAETRDADSTNMADQKEEKESDLQGGQLQVDRTTNDLQSEQNINAPLRTEASPPYDREGFGQQQRQEPDEPQAQPDGQPPNQLTESRETHDPFSALKHGPEEQPPRLESTETQEQSTSQKISPGGNPNQEQSAGQQPTASTDPKNNTTDETASYESSKVSDKSSLDSLFHKPSEIPEIQNDESLKSENFEKPISGLPSPLSDEPTLGFPSDQGDETPIVSDQAIELEDQKQKKSSRDKTDSKLNESVPAETTEQQEENEIKEFPERSKQLGQVVFIEKPDQPAIRDLLRNCQSYQMEFPIVGNLKAANDEYEYLLKKEKDTGFKKHKSKHPPSELSFVNDTERNQAPLLYAVIADVSKKVPNYSRWREAVSEFINLTTISQLEPHSSKKKRTKSHSGYQTKPPVKPAKSYRNNIEKLLDQEWGPKRAPVPSVLHDYRHLFTCESVLRSTFPEADIFGLADSTFRGPEDVPQELRHKALYHFLLPIKSKTYGVEPSDAWRDFGRLVLAEKQLELAKKAQGPDLHQNIIVKRLDFYKMQNELKEKTEEVEELSTRLSKFASQ